MYYRYGHSDGWGETRTVMATVDPEEVRKKLQGLVLEFFEMTGLDWSGGCVDRRALDDKESNRVFALASLAAAARSTVARDWRTREVVEVPFKEAPTRLAGALGQLYLGLEVIGLDERERWRVVGKVAMDSMPAGRLKVVERLRVSGGVTGRELEGVLKCSAGTVRYVCEDLEIHGVVERVEKGGGRMGERVGSWGLSEWAKSTIGVGWSAI